MNKEQLKEAVDELNLVDTVFEYDGVSYIDTAVSVMQVYDLIDQLDEPEVLSLEWVEEHRKSYTMEDSVEISDLQNLLVPKHELPVIPKYVADWIEKYKEREANVWHLINNVSIKKDCDLELWSWLWGENNVDVLARAWLDGYEVAEEQKYYARLKEVHPPEKEWLTNLTGPNYYAIDTKGLMLGEFILNLVGLKTKASTHTIKDWERHGINDSNADFVRVEENE